MPDKDELNPSNCECECHESCDVGQYLDYENCKYKKKIVDKLVEECIETAKEVKLAKTSLSEDENKHKSSSCTLYTVLFSNFHNKHWNWYLLCLLRQESLIHKKRYFMC